MEKKDFYNEKWINKQATEITKFGRFFKAPLLIRGHFIKQLRIYFKYNKIQEISARDLNVVLKNLTIADCHEVLIFMNNEVFKLPNL